MARRFDKNYTVVIHEPRLYEAVLRCKRSPHRIWTPVLARIVVGFLDANSSMRRFDVIMPAPAYPGPDGDEYSHAMSLVQEAARIAEGRWPFAISGGPVVKIAETDQMSNHNDADGRDGVAKELRDALRLSTGADVRGRRFLVIDDVLTRGNTLNETARVLKDAGAVEVSGLSLIRKKQPPREAS